MKFWGLALLDLRERRAALLARSRAWSSGGGSWKNGFRPGRPEQSAAAARSFEGFQDFLVVALQDLASQAGTDGSGGAAPAGPASPWILSLRLLLYGFDERRSVGNASGGGGPVQPGRRADPRSPAPGQPGSADPWKLRSPEAAAACWTTGLDQQGAGRRSRNRNALSPPPGP